MATTIQGSRSSKYIKEKIQGIDGTEDTQKYATMVHASGDRIALDMVQHGKTLVSQGHQIEAGSVKRWIKSSAHGARVGWIMQPSTGYSLGEEITIIKIIDEDTFVISADFVMAIGDEFKLYKHITANYNADGDINVQVTNSGPTQFLKDGSPTTVSEDTSDPNSSEPLPVKVTNQPNGVISILREGVPTEVSKSATPANTVPVPVEIVSSSGTEVNISVAGNLVMEITDMGANFSSMRLGDGSGRYAEITVDNEVLVKDSDVLAELGLISAKDFSTSTKQDTIISELEDVNTNLGTINTTVTGVAKTTDITALTGVATTIANEIGATNASVATSDTGDFSLIALFKRSLEKLTGLSSQLPASLGAKTGATSLSVVPASDAVFQTNKIIPSSGSQSKGNIASGNSTTVSAPVGAKGFILKNNADSEGFLCWEIGGTADANSMDQAPMTGTAFVECSADISIYANGGAVKYAVQWFV